MSCESLHLSSSPLHARAAPPTFTPANYLLPDAEKNKYFKVVADPAALYSKTAVRKRKADEAIATENARVEKANRERVTRSRIVGKLEREMGRGDGRLEVLKEFVRGFQPGKKPTVPPYETPQWRVFDIDQRSGWMACCERPMPSVVLLIKRPLADYDVANGNAVDIGKRLAREKWFIHPGPGDLRYTSTAKVNSVNFSASGEFVLTTWVDPSQGRNVNVTDLSTPDRTSLPSLYSCRHIYLLARIRTDSPFQP